MRVILCIAMVLTTVVTISGQRSGWPWSRYGGMRNPRCISCSEVKEAHLCESCCKMNVCLPNPCKNNGTCSPVDNSYSCNCAIGYLGKNCDVNLCLPDPCKNGGTCSPVDNGYSCNCPTGYLGENCDVNLCLPDPCKNGGTCSPVDNGYSCNCPTGYLGENCDVNLCLPDPCKNGGTCSPVDNGYSCNCPTGYLGENCDVNLCDFNNPCLNDGTCYPSEGGVSCSCPPGFEGSFCHVNLCLPNPCQNGGICLPVDNGYSCNCTTGFLGENCDKDLCDPSPCTEIGDICFRVDGGFECRCTNIVNDEIITSPNYPLEYPNNFANCYLIIGRPEQNITLTLGGQYSIEFIPVVSTGFNTCQGGLSTSCDLDYLTLQGVRYCGGTPPDPIIVPTGENTTVRFETDSLFTCLGFNLSITYTDV
ncbi:adhesive plaque matrix protein 2 isoform X2 [Patella vulgata]|uniref:adhesive plaque matrix protein 2 isoform X2 n=1 Tax=Patella vulgata TaxID=6465 RepID=UPI0021802EB3|nr:adhesive plaque matrix protein 2 isoform X2 [Patella vulgata]